MEVKLSEINDQLRIKLEKYMYDGICAQLAIEKYESEFERLKRENEDLRGVVETQRTELEMLRENDAPTQKEN